MAARNDRPTWRGQFRPTTGFSERLRLLAVFGLSDGDVARAVPNVGARTVRRWRSGGPPTTRIAHRWEPVDDLWSMVGYVVGLATDDPDAVIAWLRSRDAALGYRSPLEALGQGRYDEVRAAAEAFAARVTARAE
ncbi:MAG TPA: hypothetical protein VN635_13180 [Conexibacter sp.]|nr:hypothetical protein [Conexibacter sp.]